VTEYSHRSATDKQIFRHLPRSGGQLWGLECEHLSRFYHTKSKAEVDQMIMEKNHFFFKNQDRHKKTTISAISWRVRTR
jgi:hypothetical protein